MEELKKFAVTANFLSSSIYLLQKFSIKILTQNKKQFCRKRQLQKYFKYFLQF